MNMFFIIILIKLYLFNVVQFNHCVCQVFQRCSEESGEALVQEWVLMSLGNFTRLEPVTSAVWCISCFLVAASKQEYLRAAFPSVVTWPEQFKRKQYHSDQVPTNIYCYRITIRRKHRGEQFCTHLMELKLFANVILSENMVVVHRIKLLQSMIFIKLCSFLLLVTVLRARNPHLCILLLRDVKSE